MPHVFSTLTVVVRTTSLLACGAFGVGCGSPFQASSSDTIERAVGAAVAREVASMSGDQVPPSVEESGSLLGDLDARRAKLDAMGPQRSNGGEGLSIGHALDGGPLAVIELSLHEARLQAMEQNLGVRHASIDHDLAAEEVRRARAAFDVLLGAGLDLARVDEPKPDIFIPLLPDPLPQTTDLRRWGFSTDLSKRLSSGGSVLLGVESQNAAFFGASGQQPNPSWGTSLRLAAHQPLLRGFGSDVSHAEIELASNADARAAAALRHELLDLMVSVEQAYWGVVLARQRLVSAEWLVAEGKRIRSILDVRRAFDTTAAEYASSVATVEQRTMRVIEAKRLIGERTDQLMALLNDANTPLAQDVDLIPRDTLRAHEVTIDARDAIMTALVRSPVLAIAERAIDDASIREIVARNGQLPQLDMTAEVKWLGLADDLASSATSLDGEFVDYVLGVRFSQPIGNRAAESVFRQARLQRSASIVRYRQAVQQVLLDVKKSIRDVRTDQALIRQARTVRLAQAENLRALEAMKETLAGLTPEFLELLFQRQAGLAEAQRAELESIASANIAHAMLLRAMGTGLDAFDVLPGTSP